MAFFVPDWILRRFDSYIRLPVVGIDISEGSLKYLAFRKQHMLASAAYGRLALPEGFIEQGTITHPVELGRHIAEWHRKERDRLRTRFVVASLPEERSFLRVLQLPKVGVGEIEGAIRWELESNIPVPTDELVYDYAVIPPLADHLTHYDVVVIAFPRSIVETYVRVLTTAGFFPVALMLESQALLRCMQHRIGERDTKIIVDFGRNRTSFLILSGHAIVFTSTIPFGGHELEEAIAREFSVTPAEAEAIKKRHGMRRIAFDGKLFDALVPKVGILADELRRVIGYYGAHAEHRHGASSSVSAVFLSGGEANLDGLDTYLAVNLRLPVRRLDPFASFGNAVASGIPPVTRRESLTFAVAIGLAMAGMSS